MECAICLEKKEHVHRFCDDKHCFCVECFREWCSTHRNHEDHEDNEENIDEEDEEPDDGNIYHSSLCVYGRDNSSVPCPLCRTSVSRCKKDTHLDTISGTHTMYYQNPEEHRIKSTCDYVHGIRNGLYREWKRDGRLFCQREYQMGLLHGKCEVWFSNGTGVSLFHRGKLQTCSYYTFFSDGSKEDECQISLMGLPSESYYKKWAPNGTLVMHEYMTSEDLKTGIHEEYYPSGVMKVKYGFTSSVENDSIGLDKEYRKGFDNDFLRVGIYEEWYENGQLKEKYFYQDGCLHDMYTRWYENGQMAVKCVFVHDKVVDVTEKWNDEGTQLHCYLHETPVEDTFEICECTEYWDVDNAYMSSIHRSPRISFPLV